MTLNPILLLATLWLLACQPKQAANQPVAGNTKTLQADTGYFPKPVGYVNDYTYLFTPAQVNTMDSMIRDFEKRTTIEISIATLDSSMVGQKNFEAYTLQLVNNWGIGKKDKNNGVLIAIAPYLRAIRVQNGLGIEKMLSDSETKTIIGSTFIPNFKQGKFFEGTRQGLIAIMKKLGN